MNSIKLTIIALAAAAFMFSGCSTDNRVLGPGTDFQSETGINDLNRVGFEPGSEFDSNESAPEQKQFVIVAKVQRIDIEGGCWYLEADDGNTYTPLSPKGLVLETGLKLKAEGYIDENIQFFCGNGPAFVIEKYEIISKPETRKSGEDREFDSANEKSASDDVRNELNTLEGIVNITKEGCLLLKTADKDEFVIQHDMDIHLDKGDQVLVTGYLSALPIFTCYEAPVFYAEAISVYKDDTESEKSDRSTDEMAPGITDEDDDRYVRPTDESAPSMTDDDDDDDRYVRPTDESRSQEEFENNEQEHKKKLEEERRREDKDNERP